MIKNILNYISLILIFIALITHIIKFIYLIFKPVSFSKIKFISNAIPSKTELALYYILTIGCCYYSIKYLLHIN